MLKIAALAERLISNRLEVSKDEGGNGVGGDDVEFARKSGKSKDQKLAKSQKSKGEKLKKLLKIGNSPNFDTIKAGPSFLTPNAKTIFNHL